MTESKFEKIVGATIVEIDEVRGIPRIILDNGYEVWFIGEYGASVDVEVYLPENRYATV